MILRPLSTPTAGTGLSSKERKPHVFNTPPQIMCGILGIFGSGMSETDLRSKLIECSKM